MLPRDPRTSCASSAAQRPSRRRAATGTTTSRRRVARHSAAGRGARRPRPLPGRGRVAQGGTGSPGIAASGRLNRARAVGVVSSAHEGAHTLRPAPRAPTGRMGSFSPCPHLSPMGPLAHAVGARTRGDRSSQRAAPPSSRSAGCAASASRSPRDDHDPAGRAALPTAALATPARASARPPAAVARSRRTRQKKRRAAPRSPPRRRRLRPPLPAARAHHGSRRGRSASSSASALPDTPGIWCAPTSSYENTARYFFQRGAGVACESTAVTKSWWRRRRVMEPVAALACREAMKRASLSFWTRSKLCCSGDGQGKSFGGRGAVSGFGEASAGLGRLDGEWRHMTPPPGGLKGSGGWKGKEEETPSG